MVRNTGEATYILLYWIARRTAKAGLPTTEVLSHSVTWFWQCHDASWHRHTDLGLPRSSSSLRSCFFAAYRVMSNGGSNIFPETQTSAALPSARYLNSPIRINWYQRQGRERSKKRGGKATPKAFLSHSKANERQQHHAIIPGGRTSRFLSKPGGVARFPFLGKKGEKKKKLRKPKREEMCEKKGR